MKKFVLIAIVLVLCLTLALTFVACDKPIKDGGKAIIILPGLMASGLYDSSTNEAVWDPFDFDLWFKDVVSSGKVNLNKVAPLLFEPSVQAQLAKISANDYAGDGTSLLNLLAVNEDGTPVVPSVIAADMSFDNPQRVRYGAINAYTDMYLAMEEAYGDEYEVTVFNYDFRMDNREGAKKLEQFINKKGYSEVILVVHSNGGHVASIYLANSQSNRDKVSLVASFDSPLTGSLTAITTLENVEKMLIGLREALSPKPALKPLLNIIEKAFDKQFKTLINMYTVYQLLPTYDMLSSPQYTMQLDEEGGIVHEKTSFLTIDDEYVFFESEQELYEFYLSRDWAKMSNGEVRPAMKSWLDYVNSSYVIMPNGKRVHAMSLVNTHYITGMDFPTTCSVNFATQDDDTLKISGTRTTTIGDGVVLAASSFAGAPIDKLHFIRNADHYDVAQRYEEFSKTLVYEIIDDYLASK